jgi:hypothetical protein
VSEQAQPRAFNGEGLFPGCGRKDDSLAAKAAAGYAIFFNCFAEEVVAVEAVVGERVSVRGVRNTGNFRRFARSNLRAFRK